MAKFIESPLVRAAEERLLKAPDLAAAEAAFYELWELVNPGVPPVPFKLLDYATHRAEKTKRQHALLEARGMLHDPKNHSL